jgi:hypothetical protein
MAATARDTNVLYAIVFLTGLAGMLHAPWWAAVAGSSVLALYLIKEDRKSAVAFGAAASWELAQTLSSVSIAAVAGPLAFAFGRVSAAVWGV